MIYDNIKKIAKEKGYTVRQVERALFFSNGYLRKWQDNAPVNKLLRVADFLGVDLIELVGRKPAGK